MICWVDQHGNTSGLGHQIMEKFVQSTAALFCRWRPAGLPALCSRPAPTGCLELHERPIRPGQAGGGALLLMSRMPDVDWSTLGPLYSRTSDQRSDQAQQFLFFCPATSRNKKGFDLNISDLAISYCTTS